MTFMTFFVCGRQQVVLLPAAVRQVAGDRPTSPA
jgi:hypothetical protein